MHAMYSHAVSPLSCRVKKSGILKLEAAGFQFLSALEKIVLEFTRFAGINLETELRDHLSNCTKKELMMHIFLAWSERNQAQWRCVIEVLENLALVELGRDIDEYLKASGKTIQ